MTHSILASRREGLLPRTTARTRFCFLILP